jgi:hypothetical protein
MYSRFSVTGTDWARHGHDGDIAALDIRSEDSSKTGGFGRTHMVVASPFILQVCFYRPALV